MSRTVAINARILQGKGGGGRSGWCEGERLTRISGRIIGRAE